MAQRRGAGQACHPLAGAVAPVRNGRAAEVQGHVPVVQHGFHHIRVVELGLVVDRVHRRAHAGFGPRGQQRCHGVDQGGGDQRLVPLHIDHDVVRLQAQQGAGFGQTVAAGRVVAAGHHRFDAVVHTGLDDGLVVGSHHHAARA